MQDDYLGGPTLSLAGLAETFDELTLWSSRFGALLLDTIELRPDTRGLDIGCATGFPLLELANMHGRGSFFLGVDVWGDALRRAQTKIRTQRLPHARVVQADAIALPCADASFTLIVSNLGVNNFDDPDAVLRECARVAKPGARLAITTNVAGHLAELYAVLRELLTERHPELLPRLDAHEAHRGSAEALSRRIEAAGFAITRTVTNSFSMRFANGSAFMRHPLTRWFGWRDVVAGIDPPIFFAELERRLDEIARERGELRATVPMLLVEAERR